MVSKRTKSYKSMICSFFISRKSGFQDFKSTVKDKVSLLLFLKQFAKSLFLNRLSQTDENLK